MYYYSANIIREMRNKKFDVTFGTYKINFIGNMSLN